MAFLVTVLQSKGNVLISLYYPCIVKICIARSRKCLVSDSVDVVCHDLVKLVEADAYGDSCMTMARLELLNVTIAISYMTDIPCFFQFQWTLGCPLSSVLGSCPIYALKLFDARSMLSLYEQCVCSLCYTVMYVVTACTRYCEL